jgi:hypothetical protein
MVASNDAIARAVRKYLARYRCPAPADAGLTIADIARDLGLPWQDAQATHHPKAAEYHAQRWGAPEAGQ